MSEYVDIDDSKKNSFKLMEPLNMDFIRACAAEFVATMMFLWYTIMTVVFFRVPFFQPSLEYGSPVGADIVFSEGDSATQLMIATCFGFSICVLAYCFGGISGGHINPAVTIGVLITRRISAIRAVMYIVAQLLGAIVGTALVKGVNSSIFDAAGGGANGVFGVTTGEAVLGEALGTAGLVFTVCRALDKQHAGNVTSVILIGFAVLIAHLSLIPVTGTSINPARSFGPAVVADEWKYQWVFWVGPITGSICAALTYEFLFRSQD